MVSSMGVYIDGAATGISLGNHTIYGAPIVLVFDTAGGIGS